ncbi:MAG: hypothetical protein EXR98_12720 [Gemmataceae bacterium]|nr:hypothetical protein [Gemmataceae bacterium]
MNPNPANTPVVPRWLHALAVLTVLFTLPLIFLGAGVTSHKVGMVDPRGFRWPWEIVAGLFQNVGLGWLLEYGHRTFGFVVGLCGIAVAVGCWGWGRRPWLGWFSLLALGLICGQGLLGIFRVDYDALYGRDFALMHGCFAQIVFVVLVSLVLFTSRRWMTDPTDMASPALKRWSIVTTLLVYGQLVLGGLVRHKEDLLGPRGHLLGAFIVTGAILWLLMLMRDSELRERFKLQRILLMAFLALQLLLGVESWLARFYTPQADFPQLLPLPELLPISLHAEWIRTAHYLVGTLIFSTTVVVALIAHRKPVVETVLERSRQLEGAL